LGFLDSWLHTSSNGLLLQPPSPAPTSEICISSCALTPLLFRGYILSRTFETLHAKQSKHGNENYMLKHWKRPENG